MSEQLTEDQWREIQQELQAGHKLKAIKLYKDWTGSSLLASKAFVEGLEPEQAVARSVSHHNIGERQMDLILDAIEQGQKIEAVKLYKESSGLSLLESKKFVESLMDELGVESRSGCSALVFIAIFIGGAAVAAIAY